MVEAAAATTDTSTVAAPLGDTAPDAPAQDDVHTAEPDPERVLADLQKVADKIPSDKLEFLNRKFQPAFNRRLNLLNDNVTNAARAVVGPDYKLPEGKTWLDLMTENGGKDFGEALRGTMASVVAPINQQITQAQLAQTFQQHGDMAYNDSPEAVRPYMQQAVKEVSENPDLVALAASNGGKASYYVLRGAAATVAVPALIEAVKSKDAEIAGLKDLLTKNNIALKTAGGTSKAGGKPVTQTKPEHAKSLTEALNRAVARIKADEVGV